MRSVAVVVVAVCYVILGLQFQAAIAVLRSGNTMFGMGAGLLLPIFVLVSAAYALLLLSRARRVVNVAFLISIALEVALFIASFL